MLGTIVNTICIMIGSTVGSVAKRAIKPQYQSALYHAMGLAALVLGINAVTSHLPESNYPVLFIVSLALGTLVGTLLDLSGKFNRIGCFLQIKSKCSYLRIACIRMICPSRRVFPCNQKKHTTRNGKNFF